MRTISPFSYCDTVTHTCCLPFRTSSLHSLHQHNWTSIAKRMPNRSAKQCSVRWEHHLDPSVKKGNWTSEEDALIIQQVAKIGKKWSKIAALLPGRSDNSVKIRYISCQRSRKPNKKKINQNNADRTNDLKVRKFYKTKIPDLQSHVVT